MKVKQLRELLKDADDEMEVLIPTSMEFDGMFVSPCEGESGISELGIYDPEDENEAKLLNKPITRKDFVLVPHGFFEEHTGVDPELN